MEEEENNQLAFLDVLGSLLRRQASLAENPHGYQLGLHGRQQWGSTAGNRMLEAPFDRFASSQTNKTTTSQADQAVIAANSRMTASSCIDSTEAFRSEPDSSSTTVAPKSCRTSVNTSESYLHTQDPNETSSKQTYKQLESVHDLKHAFSVDIRRSSLSTAADLANACRCQSASTQTIPMDSARPESARDQQRGNQSPGSPNPGGGARHSRNGSGISNPATPAGPPPIDQTSIFEADGVTQIVGIDQWSSSGTESTTGVILRSGDNGNNRGEEEQQQQRATGRNWSPPRPEISRGGPSETVEPPPDVTQLPLTRPSPAYPAHQYPHHAAGCPRRDRKAEQIEAVTTSEEMQTTVALDPHRTTPSHRQFHQPLPVLPVDTLPVRPSHAREGEMHLQSYAYGFSRSIPAGVHLAGLSDPPPAEPQRILPQYWLMRDRRGDPVYPCQQGAYPLGLVPQLPERQFEPAHDYFAEAPCLYMHPSRLQDLKPCQQVVMPAPYMHHHPKPLGGEERVDAGPGGYLEGGHSRHHHHRHHAGNHEACCFVSSGHHKTTHRCMYPEQAYAQGFVAPPLPPDMKHTMAYGHPPQQHASQPEAPRQHRKRTSRAHRAAAGPEEKGEERHNKVKDSDVDKRSGLGARSRPKSSVYPLSSGVVDPVTPSLPGLHHHFHDDYRHRTIKSANTEGSSGGLCKMHALVSRQAEKTNVGGSSGGGSSAREAHVKPSYEGRATGIDTDEKAASSRRHSRPAGQREDQYTETQWSGRGRTADESNSHLLHRGPPGIRQRQTIGAIEKAPEPKRLKRKLVQSPSLGEKEETEAAISQSLYAGDVSGGQRAMGARNAPTSVEKGYVPAAPKDFLDKMEEHKASIEALRRELRSVETASAIHGRGLASMHKPIGKEASRPSTGPPTARVGAKTEAASISSQATTTPPMPSDEAAARLAGSSSSLIGFKDITSVGSPSSTGQQQRSHMTAPGPTGDEGLLIPPQDTLYLESDTASSLERVNTVRRSPLPLSGAAHPKAALVSSESDRPHDHFHSSQVGTTAAAARPSISPSPSISGSSASYRRSQSLTQSLFSQGAILSNASSISRHSSSSSVPLSALSGCSLSMEEVERRSRREQRRSGSSSSTSPSSSSAAKSSSPSTRMRRPYHIRSCRDCQQPTEELDIEADVFGHSHIGHRSHSHGVSRHSKEHDKIHEYHGHRQHHHSVPRPAKERSSSRLSHVLPPSRRHHRSERDVRLHECQCRGCRALSERSLEQSHRRKSDKGQRKKANMMATTSTAVSSAGEREESKKSRNQISETTDASLLKSILTDELALETIGRQQKLLKRELAKQRKLAAELAEAKRQTQRLLAEKARLERLQAELPSRVNVTETQISHPTTYEPTTPMEATFQDKNEPGPFDEVKEMGENEKVKGDTKPADPSADLSQSGHPKETKEERVGEPEPADELSRQKLVEREKEEAGRITVRSDRAESVRSQRSHHSNHSHQQRHHHHRHHHHKHHHRQQSRCSSAREEDQEAPSCSGEDERKSRELSKGEDKQEPSRERPSDLDSGKKEEEGKIQGEKSSPRRRRRHHHHHHRHTHHRQQGGSSEEDSDTGRTKSGTLSTSYPGERRTENRNSNKDILSQKEEEGEKQKTKKSDAKITDTPDSVRSSAESHKPVIKQAEESKSTDEGNYVESTNLKTNKHLLTAKLLEDASAENLVISNPSTNSPEHRKAEKPGNLLLGRLEARPSDKVKTPAFYQESQEIQFANRKSHQQANADHICSEKQNADEENKRQGSESELAAKKESSSSPLSDPLAKFQPQQEGECQPPTSSSEITESAKVPASVCQTSASSAAKPIATTVHSPTASVISEVWAQIQDKRSPGASSPSSASSSSSSSSIILLPRTSIGSPSGTLFIPPMTTEEQFRDRAEGMSLRHDLVEISCLEPVPEGRIAESYAASRFDRPFTCLSSGARTPSGLHSPSSQQPQISTFISSKQGSATVPSTTTTMTTAFSTNTELCKPEEERGVDEEVADDGEACDDSESEVDSSTSSASEGSEEIEPFPLPPPDLLAIRTSCSLGRELHEVVEEESGSICELTTAVFVAPLKPVAPLRVSRAITVPHAIAANVGKTTPADGSLMEKSESVADTVAATASSSHFAADSKKEDAVSPEQEIPASKGELRAEASVESISSLPLPPEMPPPAGDQGEAAADFEERVKTAQPSRKRGRPSHGGRRSTARVIAICSWTKKLRGCLFV
ncbi:FERM, ARHGEF and pleckstrin domain-containing protein 1 [Sparganum proliferum]